MKGVHDVFPADEEDKNDPISHKKLLKEEAMCNVGSYQGYFEIHIRRREENVMIGGT